MKIESCVYWKPHCSCSIRLGLPVVAWVQLFLIAKYLYNAELLTAQGADEKEKGATSLLAWAVVFEFVSLLSELGLDLSPYCIIISPLAKTSTGWGGGVDEDDFSLGSVI